MNDLSRLISALQDKSWKVRKLSAIALGNLRDKKAVLPLISALQDKNRWVREWTVWALGEIGDERAIPALEKLLAEENEEGKKVIQEALQKIRASKSR